MAGVRVRAIGEHCLENRIVVVKKYQFIDPDFAEALYGASAIVFRSAGTTKNTAVLPASAAGTKPRARRSQCRRWHRQSVCRGGISGPGLRASLVHVLIPAGRSVADALGALRRDAPRLRSEVAMAITRKRAPELSFVPAFPEGGDDE